MQGTLKRHNTVHSLLRWQPVGVNQMMNKYKGKSLQNQIAYRSQSSERKDRRSNVTVGVVVGSTDRKTIDTRIKDAFLYECVFINVNKQNMLFVIARTWLPWFLNYLYLLIDFMTLIK